LVDGPAGPPIYYREEADIARKGRQLAERVNLGDQLHEKAGILPCGAKCRLKIAHALST